MILHQMLDFNVMLQFHEQNYNHHEQSKSLSIALPISDKRLGVQTVIRTEGCYQRLTRKQRQSQEKTCHIKDRETYFLLKCLCTDDVCKHTLHLQKAKT